MEFGSRRGVGEGGVEGGPQFRIRVFEEGLANGYVVLRVFIDLTWCVVGEDIDLFIELLTESLDA